MMKVTAAEKWAASKQTIRGAKTQSRKNQITVKIQSRPPKLSTVKFDREGGRGHQLAFRAASMLYRKLKSMIQGWNCLERNSNKPKRNKNPKRVISYLLLCRQRGKLSNQIKLRTIS